MTLEKALVIMRNIIDEKKVFISMLEYQEQQMKGTDLQAASVRTELVKTKEEIKAIETAMRRLLALKHAA